MSNPCMEIKKINKLYCELYESVTIKWNEVVNIITIIKGLFTIQLIIIWLMQTDFNSNEI